MNGPSDRAGALQEAPVDNHPTDAPAAILGDSGALYGNAADAVSPSGVGLPAEDA